MSTGWRSSGGVSIVDISELTENIAWELDELQHLCPGRCILIGEQARIACWASEPAPLGPGSLDARVARLLDGRDVIAYTTDPMLDQSGGTVARINTNIDRQKVLAAQHGEQAGLARMVPCAIDCDGEFRCRISSNPGGPRFPKAR